MSEQKKVKIYSTATCPWCKKAEEFLKKNGIDHQTFNVAEDKSAREEMIKNSGQMGVPVLDIGGEIVIGFNEAAIKEKLGI